MAVSSDMYPFNQEVFNLLCYIDRKLKG